MPGITMKDYMSWMKRKQTNARLDRVEKRLEKLEDLLVSLTPILKQMQLKKSKE